MNSLGSEKYVKVSTSAPSAVQGENSDNSPIHKPIFNIHTTNYHNRGETGRVQGVNVQTTLLVTSSGPAAEYAGALLGIYKEAGTHNNCPYYKQVDIERTDGQKYVIYLCKEGGWAMGPGLDSTINLKNSSKAGSIPLTGWTCFAGGKYRDDYQLRIDYDQPLACGEITITASGVATVKQPECVGVYEPTQMFSAGRRVFKHPTQELYLLVKHGSTTWGVHDSVKSKGARMISGGAPSMCPADPRARTSWQYTDGAEWKHVDITVKCSVHKYSEHKKQITPIKTNVHNRLQTGGVKGANFATTLLVTSSGPSAEYQGGRLGIYKETGTHNNCPYYKQEDTERSESKVNVIYRCKVGGWTMGTGLDGPIKLKNGMNTKIVPLETGWTCWDGHKHIDDPHLKISLNQPPPQTLSVTSRVTPSLCINASSPHPWSVHHHGHTSNTSVYCVQQ